MRGDNGLSQSANDGLAARSEVRVLVALGINPSSERLLRTAARLADELDGELIALHIAPPGQATKLYRSNLERHVQQARSLGARVEIVEGSDIAATLVKQARAMGVTHLVVGQSDVSRWREITRGSVINRMLRLMLQHGGGTDLYIVTASSRF
jgi:two-component system, OmpR family, sensor histidine kinase KdpD